jgi:hypothetical protein
MEDRVRGLFYVDNIPILAASIKTSRTGLEKEMDLEPCEIPESVKEKMTGTSVPALFFAGIPLTFPHVESVHGSICLALLLECCCGNCAIEG